MNWNRLFASTAAGATGAISKRLVRKHGQPFLLLPENRVCAARALTLYAAQTRLARWAKRVLGIALRLGLPVPLSTVEMPTNAADPLFQFCSQRFPLDRLAILLGNPAAPGQRLIILGFDDQGSPALVVKAGLSEEARRLIRKEACFLQTASSFAGIPALRGVLEEEPVSAFAIDFVEGDPPRGGSWLPELLGSWIKPHETTSFAETGPGQALGDRVPATLREATFHPALQHGDFAPWNIRGGEKRMTVIDWERGDPRGVPAWDWFHFVIQPAVLVNKEPPSRLLQRIEALFASPAFRAYAARAGIAGLERPLMAAYLLYCTEIIHQTEGRDELRNLQVLLGNFDG